MMQIRRMFNNNWAAVMVVTAGLLLMSLGAGAGTASAQKCPPDPWQCFYEWRYTTKYALGDRRGAWRDCVGFKKAKHKVAVTCQLAKSSSRKVTTSVTGSVMIPKATISANVGYEVEHTTLVSASYTAYVPAHKSGKIQWAPAYNKRYQVQQNRWWCKKLRTAKKCYFQGTVYRFAYTEKYGYPTFRVVYD